MQETVQFNGVNIRYIVVDGERWFALSDVEASLKTAMRHPFKKVNNQSLYRKYKVPQTISSVGKPLAFVSKEGCEFAVKHIHSLKNTSLAQAFIKYVKGISYLGPGAKDTDDIEQAISRPAEDTAEEANNIAELLENAAALIRRQNRELVAARKIVDAVKPLISGGITKCVLTNYR